MTRAPTDGPTRAPAGRVVAVLILGLVLEHAHDLGFRGERATRIEPAFQLGKLARGTSVCRITPQMGPTDTSAAPSLPLLRARRGHEVDVRFILRGLVNALVAAHAMIRLALAPRKCHGQRRSEQPHQGCTRLPDRQVLPFKGHSQRCAHRAGARISTPAAQKRTGAPRGTGAPKRRLMAEGSHMRDSTPILGGLA